MTAPSPKVWILILHWRGIENTIACLDSLRHLTYENFKVLVVDNGSQGQEGTRLANSYPEIDILRLEENLGFAGGCNRGISYCLDKSADFIWLLNNDATVDPESLTLLVSEALKEPKAGALGASISDADGADGHLSGRGVISFAKAKTYLKGDFSCGTPEVIGCEWLSGCNLLLKSDALRAIGTLDEDYFLYFEDTELCHRLRLADWKCLLVPHARIVHTGNASTVGKLSFLRAYYHTRNRFLFFSKYTPAAIKPVAYLNMWAHIIRHCLVLPLKGKDGQYKLKAELLGVKDYFQRQLGKARCLDWCEELE